MKSSDLFWYSNNGRKSLFYTSFLIKELSKLHQSISAKTLSWTPVISRLSRRRNISWSWKCHTRRREILLSTEHITRYSRSVKEELSVKEEFVARNTFFHYHICLFEIYQSDTYKNCGVCRSGRPPRCWGYTSWRKK